MSPVATVRASPPDARRRRRVVIVDGVTRYDVTAASEVTVDVLVARTGTALAGGHRVVLDRTGMGVDPATRLGELRDGDVLTVLDLTVLDLTATPRANGAARSRGAPAADRSTDGTAWLAGLLAASAVVVLALTVWGPVIPTAVSLTVAAALGASSLAGGLALVRSVSVGGASGRGVSVGRASAVGKASVRDGSSGAALGPLALAFAAGVLAAPALPWGQSQVALICGLLAASVAASVLALLSRSAVYAAEFATGAICALCLAAVWVLTLVAGMPAAAACAIIVGAVPVALRALPSTLVNVSPGMSIDFARFQTLRWGVRQPTPEPARAVRNDDADLLVARSRGQWTTGTVILCTAAAVCAPFAVGRWDDADVVVRVAQVVLAACAVLALVLQSRRASTAVLRWAPRAAAAVIALSAVVASFHLWGASLAGVAAVAVLAAALVVAVSVLPAAHGIRSLFWSRLGDGVEWAAVTLALPAGLVAAGVIGMLRGMMAA